MEIILTLVLMLELKFMVPLLNTIRYYSQIDVALVKIWKIFISLSCDTASLAGNMTPPKRCVLVSPEFEICVIADNYQKFSSHITDQL